MAEFPSSGSMDALLEELLNDTNACTHVQLDMVTSNYNEDSADTVDRRTEKRPLSNREAVGNWRKKKKARVASMEEEVVKLRALNQELLKRIEGQSALEAEVARLKCLLVDIRGRIEGEIGSFPYQQSIKSQHLSQNIANVGL